MRALLAGCALLLLGIGAAQAQPYFGPGGPPPPGFGFHRPFGPPPGYGYGYGPRRHCRVVFGYYGPRRICRWW